LRFCMVGSLVNPSESKCFSRRGGAGYPIHARRKTFCSTCRHDTAVNLSVLVYAPMCFCRAAISERRLSMVFSRAGFGQILGCACFFSASVS
jgi:hypothetical protein